MMICQDSAGTAGFLLAVLHLVRVWGCHTDTLSTCLAFASSAILGIRNMARRSLQQLYVSSWGSGLDAYIMHVFLHMSVFAEKIC